MSEMIDFNEVVDCFDVDESPLVRIYYSNDYLIWEKAFGGAEIIQRSGPFLLLWDSCYREAIESTYTRKSNGTTEKKDIGTAKAIFIGQCISPQNYVQDNFTWKNVEDVTTLGLNSNYLGITGYTVKESGVKVQYPSAVWEFVRFSGDNGIYLYTPTYNKIISKNSKYYIDDWKLTRSLRDGFDWSPYLSADVFNNFNWTYVDLYNPTNKQAQRWSMKEIYSRHEATVQIFVPDPEHFRPDTISTWFTYEPDKNAGIKHLFMVRPADGNSIRPCNAIKKPSFVRTISISYSENHYYNSSSIIGSMPHTNPKTDNRNSSNPTWYEHSIITPFLESGY